VTDTGELPPADTGDDADTVADAGLRGPDADAGRRGLLVIAPRVIERIAARAASDVDGVARSGAPAASKGVRADADLEGSTANVALRLGVAYPRPVGRVASEVRGRVAHRVQELTGLTVAAVGITVDELPAPGRSE
jgi:uncharacterized alkaline shock family protein YloU